MKYFSLSLLSNHISCFGFQLDYFKISCERSFNEFGFWVLLLGPFGLEREITSLLLWSLITQKLAVAL